MQRYEDSGHNVEMDVSILRARFFVGLTSCAMLAITIIGGCFSKAHKAPSFVRNQIILIGLCNLVGTIVAFSLIEYNIYDSWFTFFWQWSCMAIYIGSNLLNGWLFAYQYLATSRTLTMEVNRKRSLLQEDRKGVSLLRGTTL